MFILTAQTVRGPHRGVGGRMLSKIQAARDSAQCFVVEFEAAIVEVTGRGWRGRVMPLVPFSYRTDGRQHRNLLSAS